MDKITRIATVLSLLCSFLPIYAQAQKSSISGHIFDERAQLAIPYVSVGLFDTKFEKNINATVSDENGFFSMEKIPFGQYHLVMSFMGYVPDTIFNITLSQTALQATLGKLPLYQSTIQMEGVEIIGQAATVQTALDRKKYNASDFETAKGGTAADILNKLPAVSVGPDGNISVRGTSDFVVYLNGKPTQLEPSVFLAQLSADAIENIEVITVPTASYDAQGKGGIVNVITKSQPHRACPY
ncbi:MAG: TonB-dependent receptor [Cyclobacteriaceae bacterium]|nr:TonB-dependent receptor [Cyclobacteriaceae bacterium]